MYGAHRRPRETWLLIGAAVGHSTDAVYGWSSQPSDRFIAIDCLYRAV
jgi:hypothetical protein